MLNEITTSAFGELLALHLSEAVVQEVKCGPGTGSIFTLHLNKPEKTVYLMVFCSWKLLQDVLVTCSWKDTESYIAATLSAIKGQRLLDIRLAISGDLVLEIESGEQLLLFSDGAVPEEVALEADYFVEVGQTILTCLRGKFYSERTK
jgi:hypothetical protein